MKIIHLFFISTIACTPVAAQDLTGRWKGIVKFGDISAPFFNVYLTFTPSIDGYSVRSSGRDKYIDGSDTTAFFNVKFRAKGKDRLLLDEDKLISPDTLKRICYTSYRLRITTAHGQTLLDGRYFQKKNCYGASRIYFIKED